MKRSKQFIKISKINKLDTYNQGQFTFGKNDLHILIYLK